MQPFFASSFSAFQMYPSIELLWRAILSVILLFVGVFVANAVTSFVRRSTRSLMLKEQIAASPLGFIAESTDALRGSGLISAGIFWSVMFVFISIAGELLGITLFTNIVAMIIAFIPKIFSSLLVVILGVVLAGISEKIVKQQLKLFAPQQAVFVGTMSSYAVLTLFLLIALSELGIASNFILVLFTGVVFAAALAFGLALGLGAKESVAEMLSTMIQEEKKRRHPAVAHVKKTTKTEL